MGLARTHLTPDISLSSFPSSDHLLTLLLGYKFPLVLGVFGLESKLSPLLQAPISMALNKGFLTILTMSKSVFFKNRTEESMQTQRISSPQPTSAKDATLTS